MTIAAAPTTSLGDIRRLEAELWEAADHLRANSGLASSEYFFPVMALIFLRHAANRFEDATRQIEADQASGKMPRRPIRPADYVTRRALFLPQIARYDYLMALPGDKDKATALREAMEAIEESFPPLAGVLHKDFTDFEKDTLEDLLKIFNSETLRNARGDVFGRIYEYFLAEFSKTKAHDDGEFFTPPSIVQTLVNVIEPEHGIVFDPACGSGGMFVQTSHFIEEKLHQDTSKRVTFYGQEKTATTIKLATMNLAVHGLEGKVQYANTFYEDVHTLVGKCDFVMANPPFNVDKVDAAKAKADTRVTFGVPPISKGKGKGKKKATTDAPNGGKAKETVGNANYLWINYFWSYLSPKGRSGFVMSSQASSAGKGERDIRQRIVETGDVDVMIAVGSNFFYTRTVACELWFFDRNKPKRCEDTVLMIDARDIYRKVSRSVNDFSPEQLNHIAAMVWLYRGQGERFIELVRTYIARAVSESAYMPGPEGSLGKAGAELMESLDGFATALKDVETGEETKATLAGALKALRGEAAAQAAQRAALLAAIASWGREWLDASGLSLKQLHQARTGFESVAEAIKASLKGTEALHKAATAAVAAANTAATEAAAADVFERRTVGNRLKALDAARGVYGTAVKALRYTMKQVDWLLERFPEGEMRTVLGLVKVVNRADLKEAGWSLTPGRYVGVAPLTEPEDFDFKGTVAAIREEVDSLDTAAREHAARVRTVLQRLTG